MLNIWPVFLGFYLLFYVILFNLQIRFSMGTMNTELNNAYPSTTMISNTFKLMKNIIFMLQISAVFHLCQHLIMQNEINGLFESKILLDNSSLSVA